MKNFFKARIAPILGIIALVAAIGFSMTGCPTDPGPSNQTPVADDYTFGNTTQTEGSVTAVTVTPRQGKSSGARTILYDGVATIPQSVGTYAVTFNVAAAAGWDAADGLSAGDLTVNAKLAGATVGAPTGGVSTYSTIKFNAVSAPSSGQTVEYGISASNAAPASGWQDGLSFSGLTGNTAYYVFARSKGNATHNAGTPSAALSVSTKAQNTPYIITGWWPTLSVTIGGDPVVSNANTSSVLAAIRADANGDPVTIQFGADGAASAITINSLEFSGTGWGAITLTGKVRSNNLETYETGTIIIGGAVSVTSTADIEHADADATITKSGIYHDSTGALNITGGTVKAVGRTGVAVYSNSTGVITVSGTAAITSANTGWSSGTIHIRPSGTASGVRLDIQGGTIANTNTSASNYPSASGGYAVYNDSTGAVTISGGTVSVTGPNSIAVNNSATGTVNISGGTVSSTGGNAVSNGSTGAVNISGGTVSATTGNAVYNFGFGVITISGTPSITSANTEWSGGTVYLNNTSGSTPILILPANWTDLIKNTASSTPAYVICPAPTGSEAWIQVGP